jgi:hypothetical protein
MVLRLFLAKNGFTDFVKQLLFSKNLQEKISKSI